MEQWTVKEVKGDKPNEILVFNTPDGEKELYRSALAMKLAQGGYGIDSGTRYAFMYGVGGVLDNYPGGQCSIVQVVG